MRCDHRIQQPGNAGTIEERVGGGAAALLNNGVVVFEKLRFLCIFERNEDHRVTAGGHHAPGQPDHGVVIAADLDTITEFESGGDVGHGFVVTTGDLASGDQITGLSGLPRTSGHHADHHGAHILFALTHLHGQIGDIGRASHTRHAENAAIHDRRTDWTTRHRGPGCLLHHPQIGAAVVEQHLGVVHHAAVDACHGQRHADQQPQSHAGKDELAPGMQNVASRQTDHGDTPSRRSTILMRLRAVSARLL